jgi:large subunit ribosomal protein L10Ae
MSKISSEALKKAISDMLANRKARKFTETVELQIGLRDYDPEKDKRFNGSIRLPNVPAPNRKIGLIGTAIHCDQAKKVDVGCIDVDGAKKFNKDKKLIKKWAKPFDVLLASESLMKQIPKLMGNTLNKIGKFPVAIGENEKVEEKLKEIKSTVRFQLKKVLCMGSAVGVATMTEEELRQNINMSINFLVSLLKKGWQNIKTLHIKTTMGKPVRIYG